VLILVFITLSMLIAVLFSVGLHKFFGPD